jgi:hypothetical protein
MAENVALTNSAPARVSTSALISPLAFPSTAEENALAGIGSF